MKIMLPLDEDKLSVCPSFARAPFFMIYDTDKKEYSPVVNPASDAEGGAGVKAAQFILDNNAEAVLTPRCGENAGEAFKEAGIKIYKTQGNSAKENIDLFLNNKLTELTKFHQGYHGIR